jgi:hypothetical protein
MEWCTPHFDMKERLMPYKKMDKLLLSHLPPEIKNGLEDVLQAARVLALTRSQFKHMQTEEARSNARKVEAKHVKDLKAELDNLSEELSGRNV